MGSHKRGGTAGTVLRKVGAFAKVCGWAWRPVAVKCRPFRLAAEWTNSGPGRPDSETRQHRAGTSIEKDRASRSTPGLSIRVRMPDRRATLSRDLAAEVDVHDVGMGGRFGIVEVLLALEFARVRWRIENFAELD